jgi:hypothetical protein
VTKNKIHTCNNGRRGKESTCPRSTLSMGFPFCLNHCSRASRLLLSVLPHSCCTLNHRSHLPLHPSTPHFFPATSFGAQQRRLRPFFFRVILVVQRFQCTPLSISCHPSRVLRGRLLFVLPSHASPIIRHASSVTLNLVEERFSHVCTHTQRKTRSA